MKYGRRKQRALRAVLALILLLLALVGFLYWRITSGVVGQYVEVNDVRLHYTDEGTGEPVILLHGFAVNADLNWRLPGIHDQLKPQFRVIAVDLRGHGLSEKPHSPDAYGLEMVEDITALMDTLGLQKAHLVGYSLGGFIALKFATTYPQRVHSLCVLGAGWADPREEGFREALEESARQLRAGRAVGPLVAAWPDAQHRPGWLHTAWVRVMTGVFNDPLALAAMVEALPEVAVSREELSRLEAPLWVIVGERDALRDRAEALCAAVPCTLTLVPGADHVTAPFRRAFYDALLECLLSRGGTKP
ncbi:MAG: alpha/beta fold hydrolase [Anaerolineae bacterium]